MSENTEEKETQESSTPEKPELDYELLRENYPNYDLSFKIIVIGNSGNYIFSLNIIDF